MWYLYIDESGDLGFDFVNKKPSRFFTVCILATSHRDSFNCIRSAVRKTTDRKMRKTRGKPPVELKGSRTSRELKEYFWRQVQHSTFGIYAVTLNKRRVYDQLADEKDRVYNYIARQVIDRLPFERAGDRVQIVVDQSKGQTAIREFDEYIKDQLQGRLNPQVALSIDHRHSHQDLMLQAVDLFSWGIFRKYERGETAWYSAFSSKIVVDDLFLP